MLEILQDILIILLAGYMTWDNGSGVQVMDLGQYVQDLLWG